MLTSVEWIIDRLECTAQGIDRLVELASPVTHDTKHGK